MGNACLVSLLTFFSIGAPDFELGEKRKRREKKSISRGLRSAPNKWCKAESQLLIRLVHENGDKSWKRIAEQLGGGKTGAQCAQHWKRGMHNTGTPVDFN